jgi:hypothetical protein
MLTVGLAPRVASGALAVLLLPALGQWGRYPGRVLLWNVIFCFVFLRSDGALSVRQLFRAGRTPASPLWPIRVMQLSVSLLYAANVVAKLDPDFLSGRVLSVMSTELSNFHVRMTDGLPLPFGLVIPTWMAATGTVAVEAALALGLWLRRTRWLIAGPGCAFHLLIKLVLSVGWLDWLAMSLYLVFLLPLGRRREGVAAAMKT